MEPPRSSRHKYIPGTSKSVFDAAPCRPLIYTGSLLRVWLVGGSACNRHVKRLLTEFSSSSVLIINDVSFADKKNTKYSSTRYAVRQRYDSNRCDKQFFLRLEQQCMPSTQFFLRAPVFNPTDRSTCVRVQLTSMRRGTMLKC